MTFSNPRVSRILRNIKKSTIGIMQARDLIESFIGDVTPNIGDVTPNQIPPFVEGGAKQGRDH
jgi:hypothetical protein